MIEAEGRGLVLYLSQEGRGIGLMEKIRAYKLQEEGLDTVEANIHLGHKADERDYGVGAQILRSLGVEKMRLMTNNPVKRIGLEAYGIEIVENVPIEVNPNEYNAFYMHTKKERMGHTLDNVEWLLNWKIAKIPRNMDFFAAKLNFSSKKNVNKEKFLYFVIKVWKKVCNFAVENQN